MKEATDKQLKYILSMEPWIKIYGDPNSLLSKDDIPDIKQASQFISANKDTVKKIMEDHTYAELWGAIGLSN